MSETVGWAWETEGEGYPPNVAFVRGHDGVVRIEAQAPQGSAVFDVGDLMEAYLRHVTADDGHVMERIRTMLEGPAREVK